MSLDKVLEKIREIAEKSAVGNYIYRGEPECYDKVSSSLYRQYKDIEVDGFDIEVVQDELLKKAKQYTHQTDDFEIMSELQLGQRGGDAADVKQDREIMSELQHYGGATNLIDFTTDYLIALFFACDGEHNEDGRVILLQRSDDMREYIWRPWIPDNRVIAQKSIFVQPKKGFIEPKPDDIIYIPKDLKRSILDHLEKYHGISTETIYNDLHGFITTQRIHQSAYTEFFYGFTYQKQGNNEGAIEYYNRAIKLKPDFAEAYNNRGIAYSDKDDFGQAIKDYNEAIKLKPDFVEAYYNRGNAYSNKGDFDQAIQDYNKAIELNPNDAEAYYNRGIDYDNKDELDQAIQDYSKAIELKPDFAKAYFTRGVDYVNKGDFDQAIQDFDKAIELKPDFAEAYFTRGYTWLHLGEWEKAKADLTAAKNMRVDIADLFRAEHKSVADFEREYRQLPEDIADMLTGESV